MMRQDFHAAMQLVEANAYSDIIEEGSSCFNSSSAANKMRMAQSVPSLDPDSEHALSKSVASQTEEVDACKGAAAVCNCEHVCATLPSNSCLSGNKIVVELHCMAVPKQDNAQAHCAAPYSEQQASYGAAPNVGYSHYVAPNVGPPADEKIFIIQPVAEQNQQLVAAEENDDDDDSGNGSVAELNMAENSPPQAKEAGAEIMSKMRQLFGGTFYLPCQTPASSDDLLGTNRQANRRFSLSDINDFEPNSKSLAKLLAGARVQDPLVNGDDHALVAHKSA